MTGKDDAKARVAELTAALNEANHSYYVLDAPTISDAKYDGLLKELEALEREHPTLADADSPTQRVGAAPLDEFRKAPHAVPMMSLENIKSAEEFAEWVERTRRHLGEQAPETFAYSAEPKLDGISVSLTYAEGRLVRAATRGDGAVGEDITQNVRTIKGLPLVLRASAPPERVEIRGEVYVTKADFEAFNAARTEDEGRYVNPRNFAGGSLRQLDSRITAERPLRVALYAMAQTADLDVASQEDVLALLAEWGLPHVAAWNASCPSDAEVVAHYEHLEAKRQAMPFEADGMVVKVSAHALQKSLGSRSRTPRWAVAWKFPAQEEMTTLSDIHISVGRTGALTPVAVLEPVFVGGVTVTSASLHNQDEIERLDVRIGDRVVVQRAGDVIPKVVKVITEARQGRPRRYRMPADCPVCGTAAVKEEDEVVARCPNFDCPAKVKGRIRHFASQDALNIEGLGEKLVDQLVDAELVRTPADLFRLDLDTLAGLERMAEKSAQNLLDSFERARTTTLGRLLYALGIRHVGEVVADIVAVHAGSVEGLLAMDEETLCGIHEVGPVVAQSLRAFLDVPANVAVLQDLLSVGVKYPPPEPPRGGGGVLDGLTAVVTGTLPTLSRKQATNLLKEHGAKVGSGVSKKTTFLLAGEKAGTKLKKAEELDIPVVEEEAFLAWLDGGPSPLAASE